jgi:phosphoribosyl 1,2-cyclic phosphate phosphodiesterase
MKITFLGTCACDFSPRLSGDLKDRFDFDVRRSSSMLIDDRFLVDLGPHTLNALKIADVDVSRITDLFITHTHSDHYDPKSINELAKSVSRTLNVWASEDADLSALSGVSVNKMKKLTSYAPHTELSVTSLSANHDKNAAPQHLYFCRNGKKVFYGCDGAWLLNDTYYFLRDKKLDLCVLDCTTGDYEGDFRMGEHNSIPMLRVMLPSLRTFNVITPDTKVYFSHLAPSLHASHADTERIAAEIGAMVAYDGLTLYI